MVRASPARESGVGISEKKKSPKSMAATGSADARIEAFPVSIIEGKRIEHIGKHGSGEQEWRNMRISFFAGFSARTCPMEFQSAKGTRAAAIKIQ